MKNRVFFESFYSVLVEFGVDKLKESIQDMKKYFDTNIYVDFKYYLAEQLQSICMRTLIVEMQNYKTKGKLKGKNEEEEYEHFCTEIIGKTDEIKKIMMKYPALCRCVEERIQYSVHFYKEIIERFCENREELVGQFFLGHPISKITHIISTYSDVHKNDRQVVEVQLDRKISILYKPHTMENEKQFLRVLQWIGQGIGITQLNYDFLSYETHSWCSVVEYKTCKLKDEVSRYYERMGVQLFLAYFLGTHDLHYENIIASGEYPVFIDLETLVNGFSAKERRTAREEVQFQLLQSVLSTGLLPAFRWHQDGKGIDVSGMSGGRGNTYPFKIPTVVHPKTSNMRIAYKYPQASPGQNLVTLQDEFCHPLAYKEEFIKGFSLAYKYVMGNREEFKKQIERLHNLKSRFLFADTQRYSMTLSSSYHPSLLQSGAKRELFLMSVCKRQEVDKSLIAESEIRSLLQGDIPYFECRLDSKDLYLDHGQICKNYFAKTPISFLLSKIGKLSQQDMLMQIRYIRTALELMPESRDNYENKVYSVDCIKRSSVNRKWNQDISAWVKHLIRRLIDEAVWNNDRTEVNWCQINFNSEKNMTWHMTPMNMYLYNGLAGMLLIFYELNQYKREQEISEIYETLRSMLFAYTERGKDSLENVRSQLTGMYDGESSIVYTYLILYQQSKDKQYRYYAEEHTKIVEQLIDKSQKYDLLSGNAGAAQVLLRLHEITRKDQYLDMAERAIDGLQTRGEKHNQGIGWRIREDIPAMSGMAHGNAGILMPVFSLWMKTGKEKYEQLSKEIWQYEESLYDTAIDNWIDVRNPEKNSEEIGAVAWCHGAAGILLSRLYCNTLADDKLWEKRFDKDIQRAYQTLKKYWLRDSWSLCHGICGNLWILEIAEKEMGNYDAGAYIPIPKDFDLLPQERLNPGFMSGYGGIVYSFIKLMA